MRDEYVFNVTITKFWTCRSCGVHIALWQMGQAAWKPIEPVVSLRRTHTCLRFKHLIDPWNMKT